MLPIRSLLVAFFGVCLAATPSAAGEGGISYPKTPRVDHVDDYHGTKVPDPYRWLEADVRESEEVVAWVAAQNKATFAYLETIPEREKIRKRLTDLWNYERYSSPYKEGGLYFYYKNDGLQDQSVLYVMESMEDEPRMFIDPNAWSSDGTVSLAGTAATEDGKYLAYGISEAGSDWETWRVMEVKTGKVLDDELKWVKWSGPAWTIDGRGFFYSRYDEPEKGEAFQSANFNHKVYYHRVGKPQSEDVLAYCRPDHPDWGFNPYTTLDGRYLVITIWRGTEQKYRVLYKDLFEPYGMPVDLIDTFINEYSFIESDGPLFYFKTDLDAAKGRVIAIDIRKPDKARWKEIVPEAEETLRGVGIVGNMLVARYLKDALTQVKMFTMKGKFVREVKFPKIGSAWGFQGQRKDTETFYTFSSFATPPSIYRFDMITGKSTLFRTAKVEFKAEDYEVKQVFYSSKDGTRVPMFLSHRKGIRLDGSNPTLYTGYGGFNISLTPYFSIMVLAWMEMGGVFAMANLRGGGEYGKEWHEAGKKAKRQNVFDDFIAGARWLIEKGYTRPGKLAIQGGSNGGLLVGAVMVQEPGLFGAVIPDVGLMDMLRYHKFTSGRFWVDEFGSSDDPEAFKTLFAYSPYHNIRKGTRYAPTLATTADTDDRVVPSHSFKFIAALQHAQGGKAPVLIRIETQAGHGGGTPMTKIIAEVTDKFAFLVKNLEMKIP